MPYYSNGYNPYYNNPYLQQVAAQTQVPIAQPSPTPAANGFIWVQGEAGARSYPVSPGSSVLLMDSENELFYIKQTDASGVPMPLRIFNYKEITSSKDTAPVSTPNYVTTEEFEKKIGELSLKIDSLRNKNQNGFKKGNKVDE